MKVDKLTGRHITVKDKEYIYCSGTDYLGMSYCKGLLDFIQEGYNLFGLNYGCTRKHGLFEDIYQKAEAKFAHWLGLEAGLTVSSGTLAGQLVRHITRAMSYAIIEAPRLHPSLKDIYDDATDQKLKENRTKLIEKIRRHPSTKIAILAVTVDPLNLGTLDLSFLDEIKGKEICLILDDTHGFGVLGHEGSGYYSQHPELNRFRIVVVSSLAKALALPGGMIAGDQAFIDRIASTGHFAGSSPMSPAYLYGFLQSWELYQKHLVQLRINLQRFKAGISSIEGINSIQDFPIFLFNDKEISDRLKDKGIWISSIRYPYPHSDLLNRLIINGVHSENDISELIKKINQV